MNHITQRNQLEKRLKSYNEFMAICPFESIPKLVQEISKLHNRIRTINSYKVDKLVEPVVFQFETKQSKINF